MRGCVLRDCWGRGGCTAEALGGKLGIEFDEGERERGGRTMCGFDWRVAMHLID